ncbi:MAG: amidohydrolase family protein, partial [Acidimicrobiia bacterium]|nr:amidohydrolase family protein [Acidimicrobiia bacterium]
ADLPRAEQVARLRLADTRAAILAEGNGQASASLLDQFGDRTWPFDESCDYEPPVESSIDARARREGRRPDEVLYDLQLQHDGAQLFMVPILNYADNTFEPLREMLEHPTSVLGLADGGAHCAIICDASMPTTMLTHWTRDRTRGPKLDVATVVRKQTRDTAHLYGLDDRGVLAPGYKADVNVIDYEHLRLRIPEVVHDLPGGARRLVQRADGYRATLVAGQVTFQDGQHTGALPGHVVRGAQPGPTA